MQTHTDAFIYSMCLYIKYVYAGYIQYIYETEVPTQYGERAVFIVFSSFVYAWVNVFLLVTIFLLLPLT